VAGGGRQRDGPRARPQGPGRATRRPPDARHHHHHRHPHHPHHRHQHHRHFHRHHHHHHHHHHHRHRSSSSSSNNHHSSHHRKSVTNIRYYNKLSEAKRYGAIDEILKNDLTSFKIQSLIRKYEKFEILLNLDE